MPNTRSNNNVATAQGASLLETAIASLQNEMKRRQEELDLRESKLQKRIDAFEKERSVSYGRTRPSDIIRLNVGGSKISVFRETLTSVPGSLLASQFSGRWDDKIAKDEDGCFFIDQPIQLFQPIIDYLRVRAIQTPGSTTLKSPKGTDDLLHLTEYLGVTQTLFPTKLNIISCDMSDIRVDERSVETNSFATLSIVPNGHEHVIKRFEVTLGDDVKQLKVGWLVKGSEVEIDDSRGVGDVSGSIAIDCTGEHCKILHVRYNHNTVHLPGVSTKEGTVIRCEDGGKRWYIDGEVVASQDGNGGVTFGTVEEYDASQCYPAFSIRGSLTVSDFNFL